METRKTFLPLVAVALAMVVVAPSCRKDDDKPKSGVVDSGVAKKAQDAAERAEQKAQKAEDAAKAAEKKLAEAEDAKRKAEEALAEAQKANKGVEEAKKAAEEAKKAADEAKTEAEEAKRAAGEAKAEAEKAKRAAEEAKAEAEKAKKAAEEAKKAGQKPGQTDPQKPGQTDPQKPGQTDPQKPGQTDPQKPGTQTPAPMFTPEEAKKFVEESEHRISFATNEGKDDLARKIALNLIHNGDETVLKEVLTQIEEIKAGLARCPEDTPRKAELAAQVETMVGAIGVYREHQVAKRKLEEVGKPDNAALEKAMRELGKASPTYHEGVRVMLKGVQPDAFVPDGTARKAHKAVQELIVEVDEILKKMNINASAEDLGGKKLVGRVNALYERVLTIKDKDMPMARSEEAKNTTAPGTEEWEELARVVENLHKYSEKMRSVAGEAEKLKSQSDAAKEEKRLMDLLKMEQAKVQKLMGY